MSFFAVIILTSSLCSCQKESRSCEELLLSALEYGIDGYRNSGVVFLADAEENSAFYMSELQKNNAYGEKFKPAIDACEDFAIYFSASSPYEIAIFKCYSKNDAEDILRMCYERSDDKKVGLRFTEWEEASKHIEVLAYKRFVFFIFTDSQSRNYGVYEEIISAMQI